MSATLPVAQCAIPSIGVVNSFVSSLIQAILVAQCGISRPEYWPPDHADEAHHHGVNKYDYVIIGAGSAGSVLASRLSENPKMEVLVIEAGGDPPQESELPSLLFTLSHTNYSWNYYTEPSDHACWASKERRCYWPRGKMIGGSGGMNAMIYVRGNKHDYDGWRRKGNIGWGWSDVLPYFEKSVRPVGNDTHPQGYVILNKFDTFDDDIRQIIRSGVAELGIPTSRDEIENSAVGYTDMYGTVQNGHRMSTGKVHLGKVSGRRNLHVFKNSLVTKLNFDKTGTYVDSISVLLREKIKLTVRAKKEFILSAGAINSPQLLMQSGVGPKQHLQSVGIPVIHDLPVGKNLQDHVIVPIFYEIQKNKALPVSLQDILNSIYQYLMYSRGPLGATGINSFTGFINTKSNNLSTPDVEVHYLIARRQDHATLETILYAVSLEDDMKLYLHSALNSTHILMVMTAVLLPKSVGQIKLRSPHYKHNPAIYPNYLGDENDIDTLLRAMKHHMRLEKTSSFMNSDVKLMHVPIKECDNYVFKSQLYWRCYFKYFSMTIFHPGCTVKMGPDEDKSACVDRCLRLRGVNNLRVVDASIMPKLPSGNINAATIMIAERAADFIKKDLSRMCAA
ncbi:glucose dehydrogenase [FAD, quinone]-like [Teleopsis dalmanni]|uniref:glucose dehydrogenase [FAD, quinone]-like n=1 Tax=Teleopsis dalmanni TaxID=139649 RepID=UPI0018CE8189|nr:glucose dehydrogenase [FAD, quinone]-like [Teleopsis dalmanni]